MLHHSFFLMSCLTFHFLFVFLIALYPSLISCPSLVYLSPCLTFSLGQSVCFCPHVSPAPLIGSLGLFFSLLVSLVCVRPCVSSVFQVFVPCHFPLRSFALHSQFFLDSLFIAFLLPAIYCLYFGFFLVFFCFVLFFETSFIEFYFQPARLHLSPHIWQNRNRVIAFAEAASWFNFGLESYVQQYDGVHT